MKSKEIPEKPAETVPTISVDDDRVAARIKEYEEEFDLGSLTTVDRAQIRRMAKLELAADQAVDLLTTDQTLTASQRKALGDTAKSLSAEGRQLADSLGMSRAKRMSTEEAEQEAFIPLVSKQAKDFIYSRAICIICPHCRREEAHVEIPAGTIIYHFSFEGEWRWESKCPRCKKKFSIDQNNYIQFLYETIGQYEKKDEAEELEDDDQEEI